MNWPDRMAQALVDIADEFSGWEDADLEELRGAERTHALVARDPQLQESESRFPGRAHNCAKVEPLWRVKHTVGKPENMVPHSLFNKVADEGVETTKALVAAEAEIERLRKVTRELIHDIETYGEPRRHRHALDNARALVESS